MSAVSDPSCLLCDGRYPFVAAVCGVGPVDSGAQALFDAWLGRGDAAGMTYMANHRALRGDPALMHEGARSAVVFAFPFGAGLSYPPGTPRIAAYAQGEDYHDAIRAYLKPLIADLSGRCGGEWRLCIDSAPVMERYWGVVSGLACRTRSGNLTVEGIGTRFFLAELFSPLSPAELSAALPFPHIDTALSAPEVEAGAARESLHPACYGCRRCLDACPGGAIRPDCTVNSRRCLSYLTIEHRGDWTDRDALEVTSTPAGRLSLFGCDICQRVCPLNSMTDAETPSDSNISILPAFKPREAYRYLTKEKVAEMTQEEFSSIFAKSPVKRAKLTGLRRNAAK